MLLRPGLDGRRVRRCLEGLTFELVDTMRGIYGNTAVYLLRDCGLIFENKTTLGFLSHETVVLGATSRVELRSGLLSELRSDRDLSRSICLGVFAGPTVAIPGAVAPSGDGRYFLVRGLTTCQETGFGVSSLDPDPRAALGVCP